MFKVMQQYGTAAQPATVYYCDDEADLQNIKSAPMGAQALVIHTGNIYIADSTGKAALKNAGAPFGKKAIAGMSQDFSDTPVIAEYNEGTDFAPQPAYMNQLPMSLWNVALEAHSGRIFIGSIATYIFIFVMGILAVWCLWSGYVIRLVKKK